MAKLFANLDRLSQQSTPIIVSNAQPINYQAQSPTIDSGKADNMSLADRLKQPNLKTTNHLPQFFLSDTYTGFLEVKKFGVYEHKSLVTITKPAQSVQQGSVTLNPYQYRPNQGSTTISQPILSILLSQGVIQSNNTQTSIIQPQTPSQTVNQGSIVIQDVLATPNQGNITIQQIVTTPNQGSVVISNPNPIINQGTGTNPVEPIKDVKSLQGVLSTGMTGIVVVPTKDIKISTPEISKVLSPDQRALSNDVDRTKMMADAAPALQILKYESDRLLARLSPIIKHGSTEQPSTREYYNTKNQFDPTNTTLTQYQAPFTNPQTPDIINTLGADDSSRGGDVLRTQIQAGYPTKNYPKRNKQSTQDSSWKVTVWNGDKFSTVDLASELGVVINENHKDLLQSKVEEAKIIITRLGFESDPVIFTAFLTSLSDTTTPTYTDYNYLGKQDTFRSYKGTTRAISLGFKAVALGIEDQPSTAKFTNSQTNAAALAAKVNKLINIAAIGKVGNKNYTEGPILKLDILGLYKNVIVTANSVKVDVPVEDATWDDGGTEGGHKVGRLLPNYYNISMDFAVLSTNDIKPTLFDYNKNYIGY